MVISDSSLWSINNEYFKDLVPDTLDTLTDVFPAYDMMLKSIFFSFYLGYL